MYSGYNNLLARLNRAPLAIPDFNEGDAITPSSLNQIVRALNRTREVMQMPAVLNRPEILQCKRLRPLIGQDVLDGDYSGPEIPVSGKSNSTYSNTPTTVITAPQCYAFARKGSTPPQGEYRSYMKFNRALQNCEWNFNLSVIISNNGLGGIVPAGKTILHIGFVEKPTWESDTLTWKNQPGTPGESAGIQFDFPRLSNASCYSEVVSFSYTPKTKSIGGLIFWFSPVPQNLIVDYQTSVPPNGTPDADTSRNTICVSDPNPMQIIEVVKRSYEYPSATLHTKSPHSLAVGDWIFVEGVSDNYDVTPWTDGITRRGPARVTAITASTITYTIYQTYSESEIASSGKIFYW